MGVFFSFFTTFGDFSRFNTYFCIYCINSWYKELSTDSNSTFNFVFQNVELLLSFHPQIAIIQRWNFSLWLKGPIAATSMIQQLTSIIHSEIIGPLWKVVTYCLYERKLSISRAFEFRCVPCVGVDFLSLSWCPAEGSSFGKGWERWIGVVRLG